MNKSDVELSDVAHETFHVRGDSFSSVPERQCTKIRGNYDPLCVAPSKLLVQSHGFLEFIIIGDFSCLFRFNHLILEIVNA